MPETSLVITTHNRAEMLAETLESARRAGQDLEVIVVDDASTDDTPKVCKKMPDLRYLRLPQNSGVARARNAGVLQSSAEFVSFLDDDDLRLPDTLDLQVRALKAAPEAAFVYGRVLVGDSCRRLPTGQILPARCPQGDVFWELLAGNFIPTQSVVARRRYLIEAGLFRSVFQGVEDWDMWLRLSEHFPVSAVQEVVAVYRRSSLSSKQITSERLRIFREMMRVQEAAIQSERARAAPWSRRNRTCRRLRGSTYDVLVHEAAYALAAGDQRMARDYLSAALRLCPFRAAAFWWLLRCVVARSTFAGRAEKLHADYTEHI